MDDHQTQSPSHVARLVWEFRESLERSTPAGFLPNALVDALGEGISESIEQALFEFGLTLESIRIYEHTGQDVSPGHISVQLSILPKRV